MIKIVSLLLLFFPTVFVVAFTPSYNNRIISFKSTTSLSSSPLEVIDESNDDTNNNNDNNPYDSYTPGSSTSIVYKDINKGTGSIYAQNDDVLTVSLIGKVIQTNNEFLNNDKYTFTLGGTNTFPGFNEGLLSSTVGTKRYIKVPPNKAYGKKGNRGIPPMSDLMFEVEVQDIAREPLDRFIASVGTDRLLGFAILTVVLALTPLLPQ